MEAIGSMNRDRRFSGRQLGALAVCAAGVPVFRLCAAYNWPWALGGGVFSASLLSVGTFLYNNRIGNRYNGTSGNKGHSRPPLWFRLPLGLLLFLGALTGAWITTGAFPETESSPLAALLILSLCIWTARKGPAVAARCAGVLLWITGGLYGTVLLFSLPQLRLEWLLPVGGPEDLAPCCAAMLTPGAVFVLVPALGEDQRLPHWPWWLGALGAAAASLVTGGILSPALAAHPGSFLALARSVSALGVIRRFEALVSGSMLMSGCCLTVLLLCGALSCIENTASGGLKGFLTQHLDR